MKKFILFILILFPLATFGYDAKMRVADETGAPVENAEVLISFIGIGQGQSDTHRGKTDSNGVFSANGKSLIEVYMEAKKRGHYPARLDGLSPKKDHDQLIVLPRVLKPLPLYAWDTSMGRNVRAPTFPIQNTWIGFDFEAADWVAPHGKGNIADILFKFRNEFKGYQKNIKNLEAEIDHDKRLFAKWKKEWSMEDFKLRTGKWDAELDISFPGENEGLYEETRFLPYSQMKMPHEAPEEGYVPTWHYEAKTYSPTTARENIGFFLRTRVKLDEKGDIMSANYAKVMGDFHLDARGWVMFAYYFNPTPNDRNLEFDTKKNLFPKDFPGSTVIYP